MIVDILTRGVIFLLVAAVVILPLIVLAIRMLPATDEIEEMRHQMMHENAVNTVALAQETA